MIISGLARQIFALRAQANASNVPSGLLNWWGALQLPDGAENAPAISYTTWQACMNALRQSALTPGLVPSLASVDAITMGFRDDGPVPIAIAAYPVFSPSPAFREIVTNAAANGSLLPTPLPALADVLEPEDVFCVAAPMHAQWGLTTPALRTRVIRWVIDERFYFSLPSSPRPERIEVDLGDGKGWHVVHFGDSLVSVHPVGNAVEFTVRCTWGGTTRVARGVLPLSDEPAAPLPDDTWTLYANNGNSGTAYVYRAPGHADVVKPIVVAEGFPGGYACDYLYDLWNQQGLLESLRSKGFDVVLLAFANGVDLIENNAPVVVACLDQIMSRTPNPIATGGVSMGGLCTRYALAWMEQRSLPHNTHLYFSVDTPHGGSATSVSVQWFTQFFRKAMPMAADFASLIDTPANQEFLIEWLNGGDVGVSPLRTSLLQQFANMGGYPQRPRRIAVSCGHGNGGSSIPVSAPLLKWTGSHFVSASLFATPTGNQPATIAQGYCLLAPPVPMELLSAPSAVSWEGAPGGQSNYLDLAGKIAKAIACGSVNVVHPQSCVVPTVSALDMVQDPFAPIPPPSAGTSPFHDYRCSDSNQFHLVLTAPIADWLLSQLTSEPASAS